METNSTIPPLPHGCNSWIIVKRTDGQSVLETYSAKVAGAINQDRYEVLTALEYLQRLNRPSPSDTAAQIVADYQASAAF